MEKVINGEVQGDEKRPGKVKEGNNEPIKQEEQKIEYAFSVYFDEDTGSVLLKLRNKETASNPALVFMMFELAKDQYKAYLGQRAYQKEQQKAKIVDGQGNFITGLRSFLNKKN